MRVVPPAPGWTLVALCACVSFMAGMAVAGEVIVDLRHLQDHQVEQEYFRLERPMQLHIECEGAGESNQPSLFAYGWLLEAATREVPWVLDHKNSSKKGRNRRFDDVVDLPAGDYIASYGAYWTGGARVVRIFGREIVRFQGGKKHVSGRDMRRWRLTISTVNDDDMKYVEYLSQEPEIGDDRTFVKLAPMGDDQYETEGFTLPERMTIEVYCQGEYVAGYGGPVDLGWIQDARTRERVWEFLPRKFRHGGGADKNRVVRQRVTLPAGNYVAGYATDGSHSAADWNAFPPYDPQGWGMVLFAETPQHAKRIEAYDPNDQDTQTLVSIIEQGDYVFARQGFELKTPAEVHIYAIGEYDFSNHQFVDQGWVEEFGSGREVWRMKRREARHAGGASKNLLVDETVRFKPGKYVVYYTSDDSHSFSRWNASAPHDPRFWGISLTAADADFDMKKVVHFDVDEVSDEALVRIHQVRNGEHIREPLHLNRTTKVRIMALGEGDYEGMYDYAWIEDTRTGRWVWEMRYRETRHAGGARKNRLFDRIVELPAGEYEVHYVTDDSHAWGSWNRAHPRRPQAWGITVSLAPE